MPIRLGDDEEEKGPFFAPYSILRKSFIRELVLSTIFIFSFAATFLIGWDAWINPLDYVPITIIYTILFSLAIAIVVTVPIGVLWKFIQNKIDIRKQKGKQEKNEKDFLDQ
jgi:hypothetical protein